MVEAARVHAHGHAVFFGGAKNRPVVALAKRRLPGDEHGHLHEARIARATLYFLGGEFGVVQRHDDGGAQARLLVEPFLRHPVVDRRADHGRHVLAMQGGAAPDAGGDRVGHAEGVERALAQQPQVRPRLAVGRAPVGASGNRRVRRVAGQVPAQLVNAPVQELLTPVGVEIGHDRLDGGHDDMRVAIDRGMPEHADGSCRRPRRLGHSPSSDPSVARRENFASLPCRR